MTEEKVNELLIVFLAETKMVGLEGEEAKANLTYLAGAYDMALAVKNVLRALKESDGDT